MTIRIRNLVASRWAEGQDGWTERLNPADQSDCAVLWSPASPEQVDQAVAAARAAAGDWAEALPEARASILQEMARLTLEKCDALAAEMTREQGKPLADARGEITFAASVMRYFAGEALRLDGRFGRSIRAGVDVEVRREPLGVVAMVTPWNFPFLMPAWKLAPALAHGNAVVLKPSELTPIMAARLAEIASAAGLPDGVLQLVLGDGAGVGARLVGHEGIDGVTFTGSTETGGRIARMIAPHKALQMEMGGKNPIVVMEDAALDRALDAVLRGAFYGTGQRCTASSRIILHAPIADSFQTALTQRIRVLRTGPGNHADSEIGPLVSAEQKARVQGYLDHARSEGATVIAEGPPPADERDGHYIRPVLLGNLPEGSSLLREEVFGPVATLQVAQDFDQALAMANDTDYGLSASIYTGSLAHASAFKRGSTAGMVQVNLPTFGADYHAPFGGHGLSGAGPEELGGARDFYTRSKTAFTASR